MEGACLEEVRNEAREAHLDPCFLCHTKTSGGSQEVYKGTKCTKKKGVQEEKAFKEGVIKSDLGFEKMLLAVSEEWV